VESTTRPALDEAGLNHSEPARPAGARGFMTVPRPLFARRP
jgi:hypothetical protein